MRDFRFTGDLFAVPEGTPLFAGNTLGISIRREGDTLRFGFPVSVIVGHTTTERDRQGAVLFTA